MDRTNEELCLLIQSGDQQAKQDLCIKNQRLIGKVAAAYVGYNGNDLDIDDLTQVGFLGLLAAAEKYDAGNGAKFSTYAVHWIKREIKQEIREHSFLINNQYLTEFENNTGYLRVGLGQGDGSQKKELVERLVASAFLDNPDPEHLKDVDHKNQDPLDNRVDNLRWISRERKKLMAEELDDLFDF